MHTSRIVSWANISLHVGLSIYRYIPISYNILPQREREIGFYNITKTVGFVVVFQREGQYQDESRDAAMTVSCFGEDDNRHLQMVIF